MPQEAEYLQRATDAYRQAQALYERIPGFPGVAVSLRRTQRSLDQIDERSAERSIDRESSERVLIPSGPSNSDPGIVKAPDVHGANRPQVPRPSWQ